MVCISPYRGISGIDTAIVGHESDPVSHRDVANELDGARLPCSTGNLQAVGVGPVDCQKPQLRTELVIIIT